MLYTILVYFAVFSLIILITLQIIFIRMKLSKLETTQYNTRYEANKNAINELNSSNKLQVYGLIVNTKLTDIMNNIAFSTSSEFYDIVTPQVFNIPYTCKTGLFYFDVECNRVGALIIKSNQGANDLIESIKNNRLRYLLINNQWFLCNYSDSSQNSLATIMSKKHNESLSNHYIILLYAIKSQFNVPLADFDSSCISDLKPFIGSVNVADGDSTRLINMKKILQFDTNMPYIPVQVLAYKI